MLFCDLKLSWWLPFSRTFLGQQLHQVVAWQVDKRSENHLCSHLAPKDKNRDISRNVCLLIISYHIISSYPIYSPSVDLYRCGISHSLHKHARHLS